MRFEVNEKIRVWNRIGRQTDNTMNYATYLRPDNNPGFLIVNCLGKECLVDSSNCWKWCPVSDDDEVMAKWASERLPEILNFIVAGFDALYKLETDVVIVNNDNGMPSIQIDSDYVVTVGLHDEVYPMTVSVKPNRFERRSIGRVIEHFGWSCTTYHGVNNYPSAPDEVEDVEYGTHTSPLGIAQMAVKAMAECYADNYWTHVNECQMAEELKKEGLL